jgi:hypothetical protein
VEPLNVNRRDSIFDSAAESDLFRELDSRWNPKLRLFSQTPLRSLLDLPQAEIEKMKLRHLRYFRAASVDFTFIGDGGRPLLSIEFDGMGGGFGHGTRYIRSRSTPDPNRDWKIEFKLRAAARARYPLFVVSFPETEHFEEEESATMVDGIVGQLLSREAERAAFEEMVAEDDEYLDRLPRHEAHEHIEDLLLQASVLSDLEHDPLAALVAKESGELFARFGLGTGEAHYPWMYDPPAPDAETFPPSPEVLRDRLAAFKNARRVGAKFGVPTGRGSYVHAEVWMRNLGQEHGLLPELIASQLAHLCALRKLRRAAEAGRLDSVASVT